ncbi:MAG: outer membrane protein assembly factor BamD [Candidatus Marinimicrobia bacterium]|nr:outer membrane protein assembly factor BamD [Candidatus Neomarinimicrobiota bacterium]
MKYYILLPMIIIIIAALATDCSSQKELIAKSDKDYFDQGMKYFKNKKWEKAISTFDIILLNYPGSEYADDAKFYSGEAYLNKKEFLLAINEYEELTIRFPNSEYIEKASFKIGYAYYKLSPHFQLDQEYTKKAIFAFQDFIDTYPESELCKEAEKYIHKLRNKLARKLYETGKFYIRFQEYNSALIYFDDLLEKYYDTDWADDAELGRALCYIKLKEFDKYKEILAKYNNNENEKLKNYISILKRNYDKELKKIERQNKKGK